MLSYRLADRLAIWPIRFICTESHCFSSDLILGDRCPKIVFLFLNCWHILHGLAHSFLAWQGLPNIILIELFSQVYYNFGSLYRNGTTLSHVYAEFKVRILFYQCRLSQLCQEFAWSTGSSIRKYMCWVGIFFFHYFCCFLTHVRELVGKYLFFSIEVYGNLLIISSITCIPKVFCWILCQNYSRMGLQLITLWDSLWVAAYTRFLNLKIHQFY